MLRRQVRPVQSRRVVMHRVEAVVETQKVENGTREVARVGKIAFGVTAVVLQVIECHNHSLSEKGRNEIKDDENRRPGKAKERHDEARVDESFEHKLRQLLVALQEDVFKVAVVGDYNAGHDGGKIKKHVEYLASETHLRCFPRIACRLEVGVVCAVVSRSIGGHGPTLPNCQSAPKEGLCRRVVECGGVHRVVRRDTPLKCGEYRQKGTDACRARHVACEECQPHAAKGDRTEIPKHFGEGVEGVSL